MYSKEAALLKQIAESRESIRQKHLQLKTGLHDVQTDVSKVFQPIIKPLNEIASKQKEKKTVVNFLASTPHKRNLSNRLFSDVEDEEDEAQETEEPSLFETITSSKENDTNNNEKPALVDAVSNAQKYLAELDDGGFNNDTAFGVRKAYGDYKIGNKIINFKDGKIIVGEEEYPETSGLLELLFKKRVDENLITKKDASIFQKIALDTNLLRKSFKPNTSFKTPSQHAKFDTYLRDLNPSNQLKNITGKGLPKFMIAKRNEPSLDYKYWDDPNELVDRLRLLVAERSAGNNNHDNEIQAIIEELREAKIIR